MTDPGGTLGEAEAGEGVMPEKEAPLCGDVNHGKKSSREESPQKDVGTQTLSWTSIPESRFSSYDSRLEISYDRQETDLISFSQWHKRMQKDHDAKLEDVSGKPQFSTWGWCNRACAPCRYLEAADYDKKLCVICFKFRTFKAYTTGILIAAFFYLILYELLGEKVLPGGIFFFLLLMFVLAFATGILFINIGLPATVGQLLVGIIFANLPFEYDDKDIFPVMEYSEKFVLVIILIRAAVQLDFAQFYGNFRVIMLYAFFPYLSEFVLHCICGYYLMQLPWQWSGLLGVILAPVSLATVVSILEKNRAYIHETKLTTILIAACSAEVILSLYGFSILFAAIFSKGLVWVSSWWALLIAITLQLIGGFAIGLILGIMVGMFPDRRSDMAPYCRIILIGSATVGLVLAFNQLGMSGVGVLSSLTMIFIASNIWQELGWHESSNPVIYFYSMLYFFAQPVCISLVGYSMRFDRMELYDVGISIATIVIGLLGRELTCMAISLDKSLPTNWREKTFICICWTPKGAVEALLSIILRGMVQENYEHATDPSFTLEDMIGFSEKILYTATLSILITSPVASLLTTFLTPRLLKQ